MPAPFLLTLQRLRLREEVVLYDVFIPASQADQDEVCAFLEEEYLSESLEYPGAPPPFDPGAAVWAAQTYYAAAQLLLYRQHAPNDLPALLPPYHGEMSAGAVLSADLTLRFLPDVIVQLKRIDPEDQLIPILEDHLLVWHYSGIAYPLPAEKLNFELVCGMFCLRQLYIDRVIENKNAALARHDALKASVEASLGPLKNAFYT